MKVEIIESSGRLTTEISPLEDRDYKEAMQANNKRLAHLKVEITKRSEWLTTRY